MFGVLEKESALAIHLIGVNAKADCPAYAIVHAFPSALRCRPVAALRPSGSALLLLPRERTNAEKNLAIVYAGLGQKDAAFAAARRATELLPLAQDMLDGSYYLSQLAKIEAQVGETDSALKLIEQLLVAPASYEVSAASLRTDPAWDPLRKDPRFQKLIADAEAAQAKIKP